MNNVYGYVNGKEVYSRDEFIFKTRRFEAIESDDELLAFAEKVTSNWSYAGHHHSFTGYYLSDYALSEPYCSLTHKEFNRLKELQVIAREEAKRKEDAEEWRYLHTNYWADNSVEEVWENKYGKQKTVLVVGAHGDAC